MDEIHLRQEGPDLKAVVRPIALTHQQDLHSRGFQCLRVTNLVALHQNAPSHLLNLRYQGFQLQIAATLVDHLQSALTQVAACLG